MKKTIYALIMCMTLFVVSCADKNESEPAPLTPTEITGTYSDAKAVVKLNGKPVTSPIVVSGTALDAMTILLPANLVTIAELSVPVKFTQTKSLDCSFAGKTTAEGDDIAVEGTVKSGILTMSVNTNKSEISAAQVVGKYTAKAAVKVSGVAYDLSAGEAIEISGTDISKMTIVVPERLVPGEGALTFKDVKFTLAQGCSFEQVVSNEDRDLKIDGTVANGNLVLNITPTYKSALVGTWNFPAPVMIPDEFWGEADVSQVVICNVETPSGMVTLFGMPQPQEALNVFMNGMLGQGILRTYTQEGVYTGALQNIKFHADGNLTAEYNTLFTKGVKFVESPMGAMRWYVKGGKLFLVPNLNMMTKGISRDGLPIAMRLENGKMTIYATVAQIAPVLGLLAPVISALPDSVLGGELAEMVKGMVSDLAATAQVATKFDFGVIFEKAK